MKTRRKKKLRYNGNILRRFRTQRKFQAWMDHFAAKCRKRMEDQFINQWTALMPTDTPSGMGGVLTKFKLDAVADRFGVPHP